MPRSNAARAASRCVCGAFVASRMRGRSADFYAMRRGFITPHAAVMQRAHPRAEPAFSTTYRDIGRLRTPNCCLTESLLWRTVAKVLESRDLFSGGSLENRPGRAALLWRTAESGQKFSGELRFQPLAAAMAPVSSGLAGLAMGRRRATAITRRVRRAAFPAAPGRPRSALRARPRGPRRACRSAFS